eukprot:TRINITY_DN10728_c0_g1_i2.p1 TRINITY_DN10728_c0_g1~~TRINITY_DN10728_c0_g1_i2.p1  ORF type:complete len:181 (-),score=40.83 TRINITY_DN10728_c0_g1_i2:193-735(-)
MDSLLLYPSATLFSYSFVFLYVSDHSLLMLFFFFNDTATTEIYTLHIVGSVRCVQETGINAEYMGEVKYHGWNLDVYEQLSNKEISKNKKKISKSYIEKSLNYGSTLAPIYRCFYQLTSQLRFKILHRLFYKEKRISYDPHEIDAVEEKKLFFKNLEELSSKISKIEPLIKDLKARRSYY